MKNFLIVSLAFLAMLIFNSCGFERYELTPYPQSPQLSLKGQINDCPLLLPAYQFYLQDMVELRCTDGCHSQNGNGKNTFIFKEKDDLDNMQTILNLSADFQWIYDKASGKIPHLGGRAAVESDEKSLQHMFLIKKICEESI